MGCECFLVEGRACCAYGMMREAEERRWEGAAGVCACSPAFLFSHGLVPLQGRV
jgi:hypothetical protein